MELFKKLPYPHFSHVSISVEGRLRNDLLGTFYKTRLLKNKGLVYCDISKTVEGVVHRRTILIAHEVCFAFIPIPHDFNDKHYKACHKEGFSKLVNTTQSLEWRSQTDIMKKNMSDYPENRNKLSKRQKESFKDYSGKVYVKTRKTILSEESFRKEKIQLESRLKFVNHVLDTVYKY